MDDQELRRRRRRVVDRNPDREEDEAELDQFRQTHGRLSDRVERIAMQVVIIGLVGLLVVQTLAVYPPIRRLANLMEGTDGAVLSEDSDWLQKLRGQVGLTPVKDPGAAVPASTAPAQPDVAAGQGAVGQVELRVVLMNRAEAPQVRLLVGGKVAGDFGKGTLTARVRPGQLVVVDGTRVDAPLTFRVVAAPGLAEPALGTEVTTEGSRESLGVVKAAP